MFEISNAVVETPMAKRRSGAARVAAKGRIPIAHEERFSEAELFRMFRVDVVSTGVQASGFARHWKVRGPLWSVRVPEEFADDGGVASPTRANGESNRGPKDRLRKSITSPPPGSAERIAALQAFYETELPPARGDFPLLEESARSPFVGVE